MIDLRHGDCLELMKDIPDNSIDMVLTDPPYLQTPSGGGFVRDREWHKELKRADIISGFNIEGVLNALVCKFKSPEKI